jgi:hypothetical protein
MKIVEMPVLDAVGEYGRRATSRRTARTQLVRRDADQPGPPLIPVNMTDLLERPEFLPPELGGDQGDGSDLVELVKTVGYIVPEGAAAQNDDAQTG